MSPNKKTGRTHTDMQPVSVSSPPLCLHSKRLMEAHGDFFGE